MPVLYPSEYDESYFERGTAKTTHRAGYSSYSRWVAAVEKYVPYESSTGSTWKNPAARLVKHYGLQGKSLLDIGCAYGHLVKKLRTLGVIAYGVDISKYAISSLMIPHIVCGDAISVLKTYSANSFNYIFSSEFLQCISNADLPVLISEMNRVTRYKQFHIINTTLSSASSNIKTMESWLEYAWAKETVLVSVSHLQKEYIK